MDELSGWYYRHDLTHQCGGCRFVVDEGQMVACEYGRREFPHAHKCHWYEPEEMDE